MKKLIIIILVLLAPICAFANETLSEEQIKTVIQELSEASKNFDIESIRKYVDSKSTFVWKTTIEGGKDGKEMNGDEWIEFMSFMAPFSKDSAGEIKSEVRSITVDEKLNQVTVIEDVIAKSSAFGETYEEESIETNIFGIREGSIKIIHSERNTTKLTKLK